MYAVGEGLILLPELRYQCVDVFFILRTHLTVSTAYSTTGLCTSVEHLSAIEGHLFLLSDSGHLMQVNLVAEAVGLAQRLHKHVSVCIVGRAVNSAAAPSCILL